MKGIRLLFAILLAPLAFHAAVADDAADVARAATARRGTSGNISNTRQKPSATTQPTTNTRQSGTTTRNRANTSAGTTNRGATQNQKPESKNVSARQTTNVQSRTITSPKETISAPTRSATPQKSQNVTARTGTNTRGTTITRSAIAPIKTSRGAPGTVSTPIRTRSATVARNAIDTEIRDKIMSRNYSQCRDIYYNCMDEFCANKDSQLRRCACSSRTNEFDSTKNSLSTVEDKLLNFSQRLLTVNLDKEDAAAISQATEGELAYAKTDKSKSKQMLDDIAKKLNTSFNNSNFDQNLNAISLSLNIDAAFDSVDSLAGASMTVKSGTALYSAALPVCREMALEICSDEELAIAESGYQMAIEQDCNTVAKSYETQSDKAREQIRESSALLDMARLDIHQKRNSDDILTCKGKMLDMLSDSSVCGENLEKCLDTTGQYIDPSTGEAFLTINLSNLGTLISRPTLNQTWVTAPGNDKFVTYLNTKKKFLEPAMENCQDISDHVWDTFIEDALAQIKLAQDRKLEEVRQSCTTLTTQCLSDAIESITDFDSRALSTFGVAADKTVNTMCADIQNACMALLQTTGGDSNWVSGITEIATDKTYETIMQTCREIGRACIIQACKSVSGNFGLCENISTSVNRKAIINRTACWDEVVGCVRSAGEKSINNIMSLPQYQLDDSGTFYTTMYGSYTFYQTNSERDANKCADNNCIFDICARQCSDDATSYDCFVCRMSERIWGNCEMSPNVGLSATQHNQIKVPLDSTGLADKTGTLLSWLAYNTGTINEPDSCRDTSCGRGFQLQCIDGICSCINTDKTTSDGILCSASAGQTFTIYSTDTDGDTDITNCCVTNKDWGDAASTRDTWDNCCYGTVSNITDGISTWTNDAEFTEKLFFGDGFGGTTTPLNICHQSSNTYTTVLASPINQNKKSQYGAASELIALVCNGTVSVADPSDKFPSGQTLNCSGNYMIINLNTGHYFDPTDKNFVTNTFAKGANDNNNDGDRYYYPVTTNTWQKCDNGISDITPTNWSVFFPENGQICNDDNTGVPPHNDNILSSQPPSTELPPISGSITMEQP